MFAKSRNSMFYRMLLMTLLFPVMGCMAVPGEGGGAPDPKDDPKPDPKDDPKPAPAGGGDDGGDDPKDDYVSREELRKVIEQRDAAKKERRELQKALEDAKKGAGDSAALQERIKKLEEKEKRLAEFEAAEEERKKKDMTEVERLKHENSKLQGKIGELEESASKTTEQLKAEMQSKIEELTSTNKKLLGFKLDNEILAAAQEHGAVNPKQVAKLIRGDFKLNEDGEFVHEMPGARGGIREIPVGDRVKEFLTDPENANLVGAKQPRKATDPSDKGNDGKDSPASEKEAEGKLTPYERRDAAVRGMTFKEYYDVVVAPREKKLGGGKGKDKDKDGGKKPGLLPGQVPLD